MFKWMFRKRRERRESAEREETERREMFSLHCTEYAEEIERLEAERRTRYFALPIYPSGRPCWACGYDDECGNREIRINFPDSELFGTRRVITVKCSCCNAYLTERMQNPENSVYANKMDEIEERGEGR